MNDEILNKQLDEFKKLYEITQRLVDHDLPYINLLMDEIKDSQPFLGSCMLGHTADFKSEEIDSVLILHLLVWAAHRDKRVCRKTAITARQFNKIMDRNIAFFKYLEKEEGTPAFREAVSEDSGKNNHGTLMAFINLPFYEWPSLMNMNQQNKSILILSLKSFIECFEEIQNGQKH